MKKRFLGLLLTAAMCLSLLPSTALAEEPVAQTQELTEQEQPVAEEEPAEEIFAEETEQEEPAATQEIAEQGIAVQADVTIYPDDVDANGNIVTSTSFNREGPVLTANDTNLSGQFYIVQKDMTINGDLTIDGANLTSGGLVLCKGVTLTVTGALIHTGGTNFFIYGQSNNGADAGRLIIQNSNGDGAAIRSTANNSQLCISSGELELHDGGTGKLVDKVALHSSSPSIHKGTLDGKMIPLDDWSYKSSISGRELVIEYCDHDNATYESVTSSTHAKKCADCGFVGDAVACGNNGFERYVSASDGSGHYQQCPCGNTFGTLEAHAIETVPVDSTYHITGCQYCDYTNGSRENHTWDNSKGECTVCHFAPVAEDGYNNSFESVTEALEAVAKDGGNNYVQLNVSGYTGGSKTKINENIVFNQPGKTVELRMNGHTLENDGGPVITVEAGTLKITGDAVINQTGNQELAAPAIKVTGGKLIFDGKLTAQGGLYGSSGNARTCEPAVYADGGELEFNGDLDLNGGLTITGSAKLTKGLTKGTFKIDYSGETVTGPRVSVEGANNYKYLEDLLADGYAFVDDETTRYLVGSYTSWSGGNVTILAHEHTWEKPTSGDIYTCTVCGVACAHEGGYKTGKCEVCGKPCPHEIADQSPVDHYYYCKDCGQKMAARIQTDTYQWAHYTDLVTAMDAVADGKTVTLLDDIDNSGKYICITGDDKTVTLDLHGHTINGGWMQVGIDRNWDNYTSSRLNIIGNGSIQTTGNLSVGYSATLDLSGWTGGEIAKIGMQKNGKITPNPESLLIVGENIGTIGTLGFYSWPSAGVKTKLNGGTYGQISIVVQYTSEPFGSLLAEGYAFQYIDSGKFVEYTKTATNQGNTISNVKVVRCPHEKVENGICAYCGKTGIAATVDGVVYGSFADALAAMKDKGESTLKLYANATYTESALNSNNLNYTKLTIDLNGYSLSGEDGTSKLIQVIDGAELIIKDSSESKNGSVDNIQVTIGETSDGKLTLESGAIDILQVSPDSDVTLMAGGKLKYLTTGGSSYSFRIKRLFDENGCYLKDENGNVADLSATSVGSPNNNGYYTVTKSPATITVDTTTDRIPLGKNRVPFGVTVTPTDSTASVKFDWYIDATGSDATTPALVSYTATAAENGAYIYDTTAAGNADAWNGLQKDDERDLCCIVTALDADGNVLWSAATASHTLTIDPPSVEDAEITFAEGWQVKTFWPDANNNSVGNTEISSALGAYTVTHGGKTLTEGTDYTVSGNIATEIGTHDLTITGIAPNYSGTKTVQWRVVPHKLKMLEIKQSEKQYDGTDALPDEAFSEYFNSADSYGQITLKEGIDYVVTDARFDTPDASSENKSYRYTVELKNPNYVFEDGTRVKTVVYGEDAHTTVSINKADAPTAIEHGALTVTNKRAGEYTVDLASLLPVLNTPMKYGNVTYAVGDISLGEYYNAENGAARIEDGKLILPIQKVSANEEKAIGTAKVAVSSENIADFTLTIDVSAVRGKSGGSGGGDSTKYTVTTPSSANGKVTLDKTDAAEGTVVTITPKADEGYVLDTIKAVDKDGNRIKLTAQADGTYTFTMPASQVKIETTFKQAAEDEKPTEDNPTEKAFADVPADAWFRKAVDYVSGKGLMSGVDQDTFAPTLLTNRAMLVTILWRMEGSPTSEQATTFKDVKANDYFYNAVLWAAENKIVSGVSDTSFAPNDSITREQLAAILYRYAVYKGYDVTQGGMAVREFSDYESISDYARGSVAWAVNTGIVSGKGNNTLDPRGVATRAEVASMLMRFCENIAK